MAVRSFTFYLFLSFWTIICAIIGFPIGISKKHAIKLGKFWGLGVLFFLKFVCKIQCKCDEIEALNACSLILSKHQSSLETVFLLAKLKNPVFVLKKELLSLPFYGWYLKNMGMISINRKISVSQIKSMNLNIQKAITAGKNVIIFPQGTRTFKDCNEAKYKLGCLDVFKNVNGKVGLLAMNSGMFWQKGFTKLKPGVATFKLVENFNLNSGVIASNLDQIKESIAEKIDMQSQKLMNVE